MLKKRVKTRNREDRDELKNARKKLKELRKLKKEEEKNEKLKTVESSRNLSEFWETIKEFRPKKGRKGEDTSQED